jgi:hypothetical protein
MFKTLELFAPSTWTITGHLMRLPAACFFSPGDRSGIAVTGALATGAASTGGY